MTNRQLPQGFSPFTWALAAFCVPILLWPLSLLISPNLTKNPDLSALQINLFSNFFWYYPFVLAIIARLIYLLHKRNARLAKQLLALSAVLFYGVLIYVAKVGFN